MSNVTVAIPVQRGREWQKDRATRLPQGTPYLIAEHDEGEWAEAVNHAVGVAETDFVIVSAPDVWFQHEPDTVQFLSELAWDCDVTWGPLVQWRDGQPSEVAHEGVFCPNRLRRENYLNQVVCFRKEAFLKAGGVRTGLWDLQLRMLDQGSRFKYVPEAATARDETPTDLSPTPTRTDVAATFYHQATPGTTYWRCQLPARHLPGQVIFNHPQGTDEGGKLTFPSHEGAAVFQYAGDPSHHLLAKYMQSSGVRVLIEADDDYTHWYPNVMRKAGWVEKASETPPEGGYSVEGHRATVEMVDGVIVTTKRLAKQYRKVNPNVYVCPNQIDPQDWPDPVKPDDGKLRVGWFASASHYGDGELIRRTLEWASEQKDVEVALIGVGVNSNMKPWYPFAFKYVPWSNDLGVYRRFLTELDVGLCPVVGNPWALCRSDLKALEYGMAQALPVCSDVAPYETVDVPKAKTAKDFLREVQALVRDPEGTRQKAKEWRDYVLAERTVEKNIDLWRQAVV